MKSLLASIALFIVCGVTAAYADAKKNLTGKWTQENGVTIEFKSDGAFVREAMVGDQVKRVGAGTWQLTSDATGAKALVTDADKLILVYNTGQPTEVWRITIKKEAAYDGRETLRLTPFDGSTLKWGGYYFRAR